MRGVAEVVKSGSDGPEFRERLDLTALRIEVVRLQACLERSTSRRPFLDRDREPRSVAVATLALLPERGICIGASDPSSALLDPCKRFLPTVLRASPHYYNTTSDIGALIDALKSLTTQTHQVR